MRYPVPLLLGALLTVAVSGCSELREGSWNADTEHTAAITPTIQEPLDVKYHRSDEPLRLGMEYFGRGAYGTAERYFRDAVEKSPQDRTAWIGLAASYDRTGRFDLADKAYLAVIKLGGDSVATLNNQGYSYMLRGDLQRARGKFEQALARSPHNPVILNNLKLLDASYRYIQRDPDAASP
jgi:Flp pilus assembly protein TadD